MITAVPAPCEPAAVVRGGLLHERIHLWLARFEEAGSPRSTELPLVQSILALYLECTPNRPAIERNGNGKPGLGGAIELSISHCEGLLAVAVAREPIGVDLQTPVPDDVGERVTERFLAEPQRARWRELPAGRRAAHFARSWVRAEAAVKAIGGSLLSDLATVEDPAGGRATRIAVGDRLCAVRDWTLPSGHRLALAVAGPRHERWWPTSAAGAALPCAPSRISLPAPGAAPAATVFAARPA